MAGGAPPRPLTRRKFAGIFRKSTKYIIYLHVRSHMRRSTIAHVLNSFCRPVQNRRLDDVSRAWRQKAGGDAYARIHTSTITRYTSSMNIYTPDVHQPHPARHHRRRHRRGRTPTAVRREEFIQSVGSATAEAVISEKTFGTHRSFCRQRNMRAYALEAATFLHRQGEKAEVYLINVGG